MMRTHTLRRTSQAGHAASHGVAGWLTRLRPHGVRGFLLTGFGLLILLLVIGSFFIDEPLRRYMERSLNSKLKGYTARLSGLSFHPLGFSLTLEDLIISQEAHPDPPVAKFPRLHAGMHWAALLRARLVSDFQLTEPAIHINLKQLRQESADKVPVQQKGWQEALESIYPFKINRFSVDNGDLTYIDDDPKRPLKIRELNLVAENIRNIRSPDGVYPSQVHLDGVVFDKGSVELDGHANFLSTPHPGIDADMSLKRLDLSFFKPILARMNIDVDAGSVAADGHLEYAPKARNIRLDQMDIADVKLDYIHRSSTAAAERERVQKVSETAQEINNAPDTTLRVKELHIRKSTIGYVDQSQKPSFRIYLDGSEVAVKNFSNQPADGPAEVKLAGRFMGSGKSMLRAAFQPAKKSSDFDMALTIEGTHLTALNDFFKRFGKFDVAGGDFSLYSELAIHNREIKGYVKPLLKDVNVYSAAQDASKPPWQQLYEAIVGGVQTVLQNKRDEVGTRVEISGKADNPKTSVWEVVVGLVRNAFIQALHRGLESQEK